MEFYPNLKSVLQEHDVDLYCLILSDLLILTQYKLIFN